MPAVAQWLLAIFNFIMRLPSLEPHQMLFIDNNYKTETIKGMARRWKINPYRISEYMKRMGYQSPHPRAVNNQPMKNKQGFFTDKHYSFYSII